MPLCRFNEMRVICEFLPFFSHFISIFLLFFCADRGPNKGKPIWLHAAQHQNRRHDAQNKHETEQERSTRPQNAP